MADGDVSDAAASDTASDIEEHIAVLCEAWERRWKKPADFNREARKRFPYLIAEIRRLQKNA